MSYAAKVWLFTIVGAPALIALRLFFTSSPSDTVMTLAGLLMLVGYNAVLGLPALILLVLLKRPIGGVVRGVRDQKAVFASAAILLFTATFFIVTNHRNLSTADYLMAGVYPVAIRSGAVVFDWNDRRAIAETASDAEAGV